MPAPALSVKIIGLDKWERRLKGLPAKIENKCLRKALRVTANKAKARIKPATPTLTGAARRSLKVSVRVGRGRALAKVAYKGKPSFYMRLYDQGSKRQRARPYYKAATAGLQAEMETEFLTALKEAVEANA
jgi:HK97 gp10 family phage protein